MEGEVAIGPKEGDSWCEDRDSYGSLVELVVEEGRVADVLRPRIASKTSHRLSTYLYTSPNITSNIAITQIKQTP